MSDIEQMRDEAQRELEAAGRALNEARGRRDAALQHYQTLRAKAAAARNNAEDSQGDGPQPDGLLGSFLGRAPSGLGMFLEPAERESEIMSWGDEDDG